MIVKVRLGHDVPVKSGKKERQTLEGEVHTPWGRVVCGRYGAQQVKILRTSHLSVNHSTRGTPCSSS